MGHEVIATTYTCRCGAQRKETNHWFAMQIAHYGAVYLYTWDRAKQMGILDDCKTHHLCGHSCVSSLTDEWMTEQRNHAATV